MCLKSAIILFFQDIFRREDKNNSGFLDIYELKSAIQTAGMSR